ncbi:MAG TPA: sigma-70 family RNA polymerase sigma factor [Urbifossiella sp.]|jgi:RNA polymerase sigma factor (sigma-70 family)|nr:sigma-70 family RNA polymerase sigma factor [Urbifossiella sp.]
MASADPTPLAARLARLAPAPTDADLLARYTTTRDGAAFAELVRRHGPAVLAACRGVTGHAHDAEDAFQATFLVLARKAARVRPGEPLAAWLYGVAVRAARKAAGRPHRRWEVTGGAVPDTPGRAAEPRDLDAVRAVAEEVGRLSPWYRAAVVLCELEGRPRAAAALELGVAEGTLSSRLAKARKELARRLADRGYGPVGLAAFVGAGVPPDLTAKAAAFTSGGSVPAAVAALAQGVLRIMLLRTLASVSLVVVAAAVAAGTAVALVVAPPAAPVVRAAATATAAPAPPAAPAGPNRLFFWHNEEFKSLNPDGRDEQTVLVPRKVFADPARTRSPGTEVYDPSTFAVSPDGQRLAVVAAIPEFNVPAERFKQLLLVRGLGKDGRDADLTVGEVEGQLGFLTWSGDGTELAVWSLVTTPDGRTEPRTRYVFNPTTGTRRPLGPGLPAAEYPTDWSRDGKLFLTHGGGLWEAGRDAVTRVPLAADRYWSGFVGRLSPDGRRILAVAHRGWDGVTPAEKTERERLGLAPGRPPTELFVMEIATGKAAPLKDVPLNAAVQGFCWSPDGRRVAYV